jgi:hypothetical protein
MFHKASTPLGRLLSLIDDVLGDSVDEVAPHPHRRDLRWKRQRRPGSIPAPFEHCLTPVRVEVRAEGRRQTTAS